MTRVMPPLPPPGPNDDVPPGERKVHQFFSGDSSRNWTVIHALDLAPRNNGRRTEVDFLVIAPSHGVIVIEVKSHENISFDETGWWPRTLDRSPFKQALNARYAFSRWLKAEASPELKDVPVVQMCIFPRSTFTIDERLASIEAHELIDLSQFGLCRTAEDFVQLVEQNMLSAMGGASPLPQPLSQAAVDRLVEILVPVQKRRPALADVIAMAARQMDDLLDAEQRSVLQLIDDNQRVEVSGPAGTGKTLIAIEAASRSVERGERVALLCFNSAVGNFMEARARKRSRDHSGLVCGGVHSVLRRMLDIKVPEEAGESYWNGEFIDRVEEALTDPERAADVMFDRIFLDEAQDIVARGRLFDCVFSLLKGGVTNGRYAVFGDLEFQKLAPVDQDRLQQLRGASPARTRLRRNCRNLRTVGAAAVAYSGIARNVNEIYESFLRNDMVPDSLRVIAGETKDDQILKVEEQIRQCRTHGFKDSQITLLSMVAGDRSVVNELRRKGWRLARHDGRHSEDAGLTWSSVWAFKGLENKVIIVTDVELAAVREAREAFYTAMTRATMRLVLVASGEAIQGITNLLKGVDQ